MTTSEAVNYAISYCFGQKTSTAASALNDAVNGAVLIGCFERYLFAPNTQQLHLRGPGSQKGSVVEELVSEYNFEDINVENTLFENVSTLAGSTVESTGELQELLRDYDNLVTMDWLLSTISAQIVNSTKKFFVIDIVPTISAIQRCASFRERNHDEDMEKFEKRHEVVMALDLSLTDEKKLLGKTNAKEKKSEKELSPELSAYMKGADEADKGRLERRYDAYCKCSAPFLTYFQTTKRILRFDLTTGTRSPQIIRTLNGVLHNLGLNKNNPAVRAILFAQNERQLAELNLDMYKVKRIHLCDITTDVNLSLTKMLLNVSRYIRTIAKTTDGIVVLLENVKETEPPMRKTIFLELRTVYLDTYFKRKSLTSAPQSQQIPLKSMASTNGIICLFPQTVPTRICKKVGIVFGMPEDELSDCAKQKFDEKYLQNAKCAANGNAFQKVTVGPTTEINPIPS